MWAALRGCNKRLRTKAGRSNVPGVCSDMKSENTDRVSRMSTSSVLLQLFLPGVEHFTILTEVFYDPRSWQHVPYMGVDDIKCHQPKSGVGRCLSILLYLFCMPPSHNEFCPEVEDEHLGSAVTPHSVPLCSNVRHVYFEGPADRNSCRCFVLLNYII